ncbi:MAG: hypothetical protein COC19_07290 [SAR86 cluster bacterium]|uniref:ABC transporter n=1 Tax=SAR86 cluster bacterium TaxID=2030880 RepID=A0A2A4MI33_9GAMM|nr:MAG: hypothetical protein COC19_07290 [SAR86 cluster bacterium]
MSLRFPLLGRHKANSQCCVAIMLLSLCCLLSQPVLADDPWQNTNEKVFKFNDFLDTVLLKPVAVSYSTVVPRVARQGIGNFFNNIDDINVFFNDILQLKFDKALTDSCRFLINTSIGIGGIFDVASNFGLYKNEEDFGQTLGHWNVPAGPYVVLPFFGPNSVRDSFGLVVDTLFNPFQYHDDASVRLTLFTVEEIAGRSSVLSLDELISGNKYVFLREASIQRREYLVQDGEIEDEFGSF